MLSNNIFNCCLCLEKSFQPKFCIPKTKSRHLLVKANIYECTMQKMLHVHSEKDTKAQIWFYWRLKQSRFKALLHENITFIRNTAKVCVLTHSYTRRNLIWFWFYCFRNLLLKRFTSLKIYNAKTTTTNKSKTFFTFQKLFYK